MATDQTIIAGLRALGKAERENLRFHLLAGTAICADYDWYVTEDGAACLAFMAASRDVPGNAVSSETDVDAAVARVFTQLGKAVGLAAWARAEQGANEETLRDSLREALRV